MFGIVVEEIELIFEFGILFSSYFWMFFYSFYLNCEFIITRKLDICGHVFSMFFYEPIPISIRLFTTFLLPLFIPFLVLHLRQFIYYPRINQRPPPEMSFITILHTLILDRFL